MPLLFSEDCLEFDHYNGVTIHLNEQMNNEFADALKEQLDVWKQEGKKGIWIHVHASESDKIPSILTLGFKFHTVLSSSTLVLTKWLPTQAPDKLPLPPTHQVGVGCLIWHPADSTSSTAGPLSRRLLVVQEQTGPAAAYQLWKLPTGLSDRSEDVHQTAVREVFEETGLTGIFQGLVVVRQAHSGAPIKQDEATTSKVISRRKASDLFFVCQLRLDITANNDDDINSDDFWNKQWKTCPDEIAQIQWMTVSDFCNQEVWQNSPIYTQLNKAILNAASNHDHHDCTLPHLWTQTTLPIRHDKPHDTNTVYSTNNNNNSNP